MRRSWYGRQQKTHRGRWFRPSKRRQRSQMNPNLLCPRLEQLEDRRMLSIGPYPILPGLQLVDPRPDQFEGQIIYLDFDGAQDVTYNGLVTVGPFDVPAFEAPGELSGQEEVIIASIVEELEQTFAASGVIFTIEQPDSGVAYSTIYIGGDDSMFREYGSFLGLAEQVDEYNQSLFDSAFVFGEMIVFSESVGEYTAGVYNTAIHEVGHLVGYEHVGGNQASSNSLEEVAHGVTIVTHGGLVDADDWVDSMADEIVTRIAAETPYQENDVAKYELEQFYVKCSGSHSA